MLISIAFILQVIVFAGAHGAISVPPLVRFTELIIPASLYGIIYLQFGLYSAIIAHFTYDVLVLSLSDFGTFWYIIFVLLVASIPLAIILFRRLQKSAWIKLPENAYNKNWEKC